LGDFKKQPNGKIRESFTLAGQAHQGLERGTRGRGLLCFRPLWSYQRYQMCNLWQNFAHKFFIAGEQAEALLYSQV